MACRGSGGISPAKSPYPPPPRARNLTLTATPSGSSHGSGTRCRDGSGYRPRRRWISWLRSLRRKGLRVGNSLHDCGAMGQLAELSVDEIGRQSIALAIAPKLNDLLKTTWTKAIPQ